MNEWKKYKLGEIAEIVGGGTPSTTNETYWNGEIPWLTPKDLSNFNERYISRGERNISKLGLNNSSSKIVPKNTILLTSRAPIGYLAIAMNEICTNQGFKSLIVNNKIANFEFVYYILKNNVEYLKSHGSGTTFGEVSASVLREIELEFPVLPTQTRIAQILSSLDDKIELNRQTNQTLEQIAQTLFKEWFVNFNYPGATGVMQDSELGMIPKGWREGKLGEFISFIKGKKPKDVSENPIENYLPQILIETFDTGKYLFANPEKTVIAEKEDLLMVMDGASSGRIEKGHLGIVGSTIARIKINTNEITPNFLYEYLRTKQSEIMENTTGSSIPHADKNRIMDFDIVIPDKKTMYLANEFIENLQLKIIENKSETLTLTQLRDSLLPKLMSGEVEV